METAKISTICVVDSTCWDWTTRVSRKVLPVLSVNSWCDRAPYKSLPILLQCEIFHDIQVALTIWRILGGVRPIVCRRRSGDVRGLPLPTVTCMCESATSGRIGDPRPLTWSGGTCPGRSFPMCLATPRPTEKKKRVDEQRRAEQNREGWRRTRRETQAKRRSKSGVSFQRFGRCHRDSICTPR